MVATIENYGAKAHLQITKPLISLRSTTRKKKRNRGDNLKVKMRPKKLIWIENQKGLCLLIKT